MAEKKGKIQEKDDRQKKDAGAERHINKTEEALYRNGD